VRPLAFFARAAASTLGVCALVLAGACSDDPVATPCSDIPAGGCPLSRGLACSDPACVAVYLCRAGNRWELAETCPPRTDVPRDASVVDVVTEAPPAFDAGIDAPPGASGGPGCGVLQSPDCPLGTALACPSGCCGCEDLFVCENGGWTTWGTCDLDGGIRHHP